MHDEQLTAFLDAIKADPSLLEQLGAAADVDAMAAIARGAGFEVSSRDLRDVQSQFLEERLTQVSAAGLQQQLQFETAEAQKKAALKADWAGKNLTSDFIVGS